MVVFHRLCYCSLLEGIPWIAVLWLFDYPNLVGIRELEWQVRIVPQFELNSYHPATAQPLGLTRWEMWRGVRTKKMIEGCQCSVPYLDAYIKMIWTDFWLSSVHFPGNFHPSNGFFRSFRVEIGEMFTLMQLQLLGHCTMLGLRANSFWPSTVSYPIPVTWCCVVTVVVVFFKSGKRYTVRLLMDFQVGMRTFGPYLL